jgi:helix-turn-helix protein
MAEHPTGVVRQTFTPPDWRALRLARGFRLADVARAIGTNAATISLAERGLRELTPAQECAIARFFFGEDRARRAGR